MSNFQIPLPKATCCYCGQFLVGVPRERKLFLGAASDAGACGTAFCDRRGGGLDVWGDPLLVSNGFLWSHHFLCPTGWKSCLPHLLLFKEEKLLYVGPRCQKAMRLFSWDSHFIASTQTLHRSCYSLIVGHKVNRKPESETEKKYPSEWKKSSLTVGEFSYSSCLLPGIYHDNQSKYSIRLY